MQFSLTYFQSNMTPVSAPFPALRAPLLLCSCTFVRALLYDPGVVPMHFVPSHLWFQIVISAATSMISVSEKTRVNFYRSALALFCSLRCHNVHYLARHFKKNPQGSWVAGLIIATCATAWQCCIRKQSTSETPNGLFRNPSLDLHLCLWHKLICKCLFHCLLVKSIFLLEGTRIDSESFCYELSTKRSVHSLHQDKHPLRFWGWWMNDISSIILCLCQHQ